MTDEERRELLGPDAIAAASQIADNAPALTPQQRDRLLVLLRASITTKAPARAA